MVAVTSGVEYQRRGVTRAVVACGREAAWFGELRANLHLRRGRIAAYTGDPLIAASGEWCGIVFCVKSDHRVRAVGAVILRMASSSSRRRCRPRPAACRTAFLGAGIVPRLRLFVRPWRQVASGGAATAAQGQRRWQVLRFSEQYGRSLQF